jgi:hypothetical protein
MGGCGTVILNVDSAPAVTLPSNCPQDNWDQGVPTAVGYYGFSPISPAVSLALFACSSEAKDAVGVQISLSNVSMSPGSYTQGSIVYTDAQGTAWINDSQAMMSLPFFVTVTTADSQTFQGNFKVVVADASGAQHGLFGVFDVCHGNDFAPP